MPYVVIENTPGYMPEDDDPAVFETLEDARAYAFELAQGYKDDADSNYRVTDDGAGEYGCDTYWVEDLDRSHDLGRMIEVMPWEGDES